jgi:hypothetical protein
MTFRNQLFWFNFPPYAVLLSKSWFVALPVRFFLVLRPVAIAKNKKIKQASGDQGASVFAGVLWTDNSGPSGGQGGGGGGGELNP